MKEGGKEGGEGSEEVRSMEKRRVHAIDLTESEKAYLSILSTSPGRREN